MDKDLSVIIVRESLVVSILSDVFSIGCVMALLFVNHNYCGSSWVVELFSCILFFIYVAKHGSSRVKNMKPEEAYEYLDKLLKDTK